MTSSASWLLQSDNIFLIDLILAVATYVLIRGVGDAFRSLAEKETLIRELYHRTKNNMQVVSSLLSLRALAVLVARRYKEYKDLSERSF